MVYVFWLAIILILGSITFFITKRSMHFKTHAIIFTGIVAILSAHVPIGGYHNLTIVPPFLVTYMMPNSSYVVNIVIILTLWLFIFFTYLTLRKQFKNYMFLIIFAVYSVLLLLYSGSFLLLIECEEFTKQSLLYKDFYASNPSFLDTLRYNFIKCNPLYTGGSPIFWVLYGLTGIITSIYMFKKEIIFTSGERVFKNKMQRWIALVILFVGFFTLLIPFQYFILAIFF